MNRRRFISGIAASCLLAYQPRLFSIERTNQNRTGLVFDPIFLQHHIQAGHPESPERMRYIESMLKQEGLFEDTEKIDINQDFNDWLMTVHTKTHIESIKTNVPIAYKVATAGVGACLAAVDKVMTGDLNNAFCATRPPGHHALNTGKEEGFCYFNNIAIAARYAQKKYGLKNILIIDWDYHHGNATEAMFYEDSSVLFFSTHDLYAYPGTGHPEKKGNGNGLGYNINIHLPCNTKDEDIVEAFNKVLVPAADKFKPELVLVSAGFDSRQDDLLGCYDVTDAGFIELTRIVMTIANQHCDGKLVSLLEGGYNMEGNAMAVAAHLDTLISYK